ncbi:hypothetical protein ATPR_0672 [Acetobacter tropicalis NBRC 101654]|uniref:Uncharacterized protein n=1 Tax=Acetobacter tropicalis NBRC 101654 TaxID=749388 RepID=F7VBC3_9PROT|nr:hypothetical protein ATPR_0672 [Acetobacter tropicalis NBRC 101654]
MRQKSAGGVTLSWFVRAVRGFASVAACVARRAEKPEV